MSREDVEAVRRQFDVANSGDLAHAIPDYAEDAELVVSPGVVNSGRFTGREAVVRWFQDWLDSFAPDYRFEFEDVIDSGDAVVVVARHHGHGRASGIEVRGKSSYVYRLRDGKIARVELYMRKSEALRAAGIED